MSAPQRMEEPQNDRELYRKFAAGYSVKGIAAEFGRDYAEIEIRLRAIMVGMAMASVGRCSEDCTFCQDANGDSR